MSFIRSVLGDVSADSLGVFYAHEHIVLKGAFLARSFPEFLLDDLDLIAAELRDLRPLGVGAMIDAMPVDSGRSACDLAEVSRRTDVQIVAATGLHLRHYYPPDHWYDRIDEDALAARFVDEIENGMTDDGVVRASKAGVIKVAGSLDRLTDLERRNFAAAGRAQRITGCPILTHTEQGTAAFEQIRLLQESGADLNHVVLSHLDRCNDPGYHREVLSTGVRLEYDSAFRWKGDRNPTRELVLELAPEFPESLMLGMDAARRAYWSSFGGKPGLCFLIGEFRAQLVDSGLSSELLNGIFVRNPASTYAFIHTHTSGESR